MATAKNTICLCTERMSKPRSVLREAFTGSTRDTRKIDVAAAEAGRH
jgi:hypothetical protein